jgi:hypoxanthine phosphoribosyltransferase
MDHRELGDDQAEPVRVRPAFAHHSEAELARILDFYEVRWQYEPDTFPIRWTLDGDVVESFSPDFLLPDLDLYVELTTLKQTLVRKKNRKLRRLRELYPDIRIKLFYARDFRMLLIKFGRLGLLDELSGTTGQATPPREPAVAVATVTSAVAQDDDADAGEGADDVPAGDAGRAGRGRRRGRRRRSAASAAAAGAAASAASAGAAASAAAQTAGPAPA